MQCARCGELIHEAHDEAIERPVDSDEFYHPKCAEQQDIEDEEDLEIGRALRLIAARAWEVTLYGTTTRGYSLRADFTRNMRADRVLVDYKPSVYEVIMDAKSAVEHLPPITPPSPFESEEKVEVGASNEELDHSKCRISRGICGSITAGQGALDFNGYFEIPCQVCADKVAKREREVKT